jgi:hypothetical protein
MFEIDANCADAFFFESRAKMACTCKNLKKDLAEPMLP